MDRFRQDFRQALRSLRTSPMLTAAALASLALGIGASAAIFSAVDTFLLKPLEFEDSDRLVFVNSTHTERGWTGMSVSPLDFQDFRREARTIELAGIAGGGVDMTVEDGAVRLDGSRVSSNFFDILGISPQMGRGFVMEDEAVGAAPVAVLSHGVWSRLFGADPSLIGRTLPLEGVGTEIVGVMPPDFMFGSPEDIWRPLAFTGEETRGSRYLTILGRVSPTATLDGAHSELATLAARLAETFPEANASIGVNLQRVRDEWFDEGFREGSFIAGAAVFFVLLIACANVANLLLARGADREREIALRSAIGAERSRIVRQLLTESMVLAVVGGLLGVGIAYLGVEGIRTLFPPGVPGVNRLALDGRVLAFTGLATMAAGLLFGVAPALQTSVSDLRSALVDGGRGGSGRRGGRLRSGLVMAEVAMSVVLLVSAVLLVKSFTQMRTADLGFDIDGVAVMRMSLPETRYPEVGDVENFRRNVVARVAALPGVSGAATTNIRPMWGNTSSSYVIPTEERPQPGSEPSVNVRYVSPDYFEVMGMPRLAGRPFSDLDQEGAPPVVIINERMAERHWSGGSPIGERIEIWGEEREIVGVVADTREWGPDSDVAPLLYAPAGQRMTRNPFLMVASNRDIADDVRDVVRAEDADQAVYDFASMRQVLEDDMGGNEAMVKVLGTLALIAFLLSALGVYGVLSYTVSRRTQELGIRQSLGAGRRHVRSLVLLQGMKLAGAGVLAGLAVAALSTRLLAFFLFGVSPFDPFAFISVPVALMATAFVASLIPAIRATRVDPIVALRAE